MDKNLILVINCGSSSIKLTLFEKLKALQSVQGKPGELKPLLQEHFAAALPRLQGIGHRFVHGGDLFYQTTRITTEVLSELKKLLDLAPLHNPLCLEAIQIAMQWAPQVPQVAVFDTAFHHDMPKVASRYAIPESLGIRRYGFHGIAHQALWNSYQEHVSKTGRVITLQLGNGCSATAIKEGKSLDTSMGFTPAEGLVMGTRAGDIDSAVMPYLAKKNGQSAQEMMDFFNEQSGLLGVSGISSNMAELLKSQDPRAKEAIDLFCYRIVKYISAYIAVLGGLDALIFSGGIGENAGSIRQKIINQMNWFGLNLDPVQNAQAVGLPVGSFRGIHASDSISKIYVASVEENLEIARSVVGCLQMRT
jgi:acetate kinase